MYVYEAISRIAKPFPGQYALFRNDLNGNKFEAPVPAKITTIGQSIFVAANGSYTY
jgi:hypothetical protein